MIIKNLRQLIKLISNNYFIKSESKEIFEEYEIIIHEILKKKKCKFKLSDSDTLKEDNLYITIDPAIYKKYNNKFKIFLFVFTTIKDNSNLLLLYEYSKNFNKKSTLKYNEKLFEKFIYKYQSNNKVSGINYFLSFLSLFLYRTNKKKFAFKIEKFVTKNGRLLGKAYQNRFLNVNPTENFTKKFAKNLKILSNQRSKRIYQSTLNAKPNKIWRNRYFQFYLNNQYFDYIGSLKDKVIINLGVGSGFEIPLFLSTKPSIILNIDPSGDKLLEPYVKYFIDFMQDKTEIIYDLDYLYDDKLVYVKGLNSKCIDFKTILNRYNFKSIDYIKSDIEGFETNLVNELDEVIHKYRPILAISIYHLDVKNIDINIQYVDLMDNLVKKCKNYNFYVNHYSYHRSETILYCIPKK